MARLLPENLNHMRPTSSLLWTNLRGKGVYPPSGIIEFPVKPDKGLSEGLRCFLSYPILSKAGAYSTSTELPVSTRILVTGWLPIQASWEDMGLMNSQTIILGEEDREFHSPISQLIINLSLERKGFVGDSPYDRIYQFFFLERSPYSWDGGFGVLCWLRPETGKIRVVRRNFLALLRIVTTSFSPLLHPLLLSSLSRPILLPLPFTAARILLLLIRRSSIVSFLFIVGPWRIKWHNAKKFKMVQSFKKKSIVRYVQSLSAPYFICLNNSTIRFSFFW